jgi:hypothetical protein
MGWPKGKPRKAHTQTEETDVAAPARRRSKNIIGTAMPYVPPVQAQWTGSVVGYRPKKKQSRPVVQPNPV